MHKLIEEQVDIYKYPSTAALDNKKNHEVTIGDLHANAMKLIFMLVKHGVAENLSKDDYNHLVTIYNKDSLDKNDIKQFDEIIDQLTFKKHILIRLIGDELADRGQNDYFILKILAKLQEQKVPVEILLSNHGVEFIEVYEKKKGYVSMLGDQQAKSLYNLGKLITENVLTQKEVTTLINTAYKPTLKAIAYSWDREKNEIIIYSHAPIDLALIDALAKKLNITPRRATMAELILTIDSINKEFQEHVEKNTVNKLYSTDIQRMVGGGYTDIEIKNKHPFEFLMWNRKHSILDRKPSEGTSGNTYTVFFANGHTQAPIVKNNNVFELDNNLGKFKLSTGGYTVLHVENKAPAPTLSVVAANRNNIENNQISENNTLKYPNQNVEQQSLGLAEEYKKLHLEYMALAMQTGLKMKEIDELKQKNTSLEQEKTTLSKRISELETNFNKSKQENTGLQQKLETIKQEKERVEKLGEELKKKDEENNLEAQKLKQANEELTSQLDTEKKTNKDLTANLETEKKTNQTLTTNIEQLTQANQQLSTQLQTANQRNAELVTIISNQSQQFELKSNELSNKNEELTKAKEKIEKLKKTADNFPHIQSYYRHAALLTKPPMGSAAEKTKILDRVYTTLQSKNTVEEVIEYIKDFKKGEAFTTLNTHRNTVSGMFKLFRPASVDAFYHLVRDRLDEINKNKSENSKQLK